MGVKQSKEKDVTLRTHLEELRQRLIKSVIVVVITTIVSFIFAGRIFDFFISRAPDGVELVAIEVTEKVGTYMKVSLYSGLVLALPFLVYQLVMFVRPALTRGEKGYLYSLLPGVTLLFFTGAAFTYFVFLPPALDFLLEGPWLNEVEATISIGNYISVITKLLVMMGLLFELPLVFYFLTKIGVITPKGLSKYRKFAIVGAFIVAAFVTPTPDPINQSMVAVPIMLLYEFGILLSKLAYRPRKAAAEAQA